MAQAKNLQQVHTAIKNKFKDKKLVLGAGFAEAKVVFVGEIPGEEDHKAGKPISGKSEKAFHQLLKLAGIDKKKIYLTNVVKYHAGDRILSPKEIKSNIPFLKEEIKTINPKVVVTLGNIALNGIGMRQPLSNVRGKVFHLGNYELVPTLHPSEIEKDPSAQNIIQADLIKIKEMIREANKI